MRFPRRPLLLLGRVVAALIVPCLTGCSVFSDAPAPIADSVMVEVLIDLHLATARADLYHDVPPTVRDSILARHALDTLQYHAALRYYSDHPEDYVALYNDVLNRLNEERQKTP